MFTASMIVFIDYALASHVAEFFKYIVWHENLTYVEIVFKTISISESFD